MSYPCSVYSFLIRGMSSSEYGLFNLGVRSNPFPFAFDCRIIRLVYKGAAEKK